MFTFKQYNEMALDNTQEKRPNEDPGSIHPDREHEYKQIGPHLTVGKHKLRVVSKMRTAIGPPPPGSPAGTNGEKVHSGSVHAVDNDGRIHLTLNTTRVNDNNKPDLKGKNLGRVTALARGKKHKRKDDPNGIYPQVLHHIATHHGPVVTSSSSGGAQKAWMSHAKGKHSGTEVVGRDEDGSEKKVTDHKQMYAKAGGDAKIIKRLLRVRKT